MCNAPFNKAECTHEAGPPANLVTLRKWIGRQSGLVSKPADLVELAIVCNMYSNCVANCEADGAVNLDFCSTCRQRRGHIRIYIRRHNRT